MANRIASKKIAHVCENHSAGCVASRLTHPMRCVIFFIDVPAGCFLPGIPFQKSVFPAVTGLFC